MRYKIFGLTFVLLLLSSTCWAKHARIESLGKACLVLEDELTRLSLFNWGNPADLVFIESPPRFSFTFEFQQKKDYLDFISGEKTQLPTYASSENTLVPYTQYTFTKKSTFFSLHSLNEYNHYHGLLTRLTPKLVLQIIPQVYSQESLANPDYSNSSDLGSNGKIRLGWQIFDNWALGLGYAFHSQKKESKELKEFNKLLPFSQDGYLLNSTLNFGEAGILYKTNHIFNSEDNIDLGLLFNWEQTSTTTNEKLNSQKKLSEDTRAFDLRLQGLYNYKKLLHIGLLTGYINQEHYFSSFEDTFSKNNLYSELRNLTYELNFRIKLPMVRKDDLRFGIIFSNYARKNIFETGELLLRDLETTPKEVFNTIKTASNAIGIGTAFIPKEGSIVALEYHLGSSKSLKKSDIIADSGFAYFVFGVQYALSANLFLRLGFNNERIAYENILTDIDPNTNKNKIATKIIDTTDLRLGLGLEQKNFSIDLSLIGARTTYSPPGWTYDLEEAYKIKKNITESITGLISFSYRF